MSVAEICVTLYLVVAIPAAVLIWSALVASKRRLQKGKPALPADFPRYGSIRERHTRPSRLHP